MLLNHLDAGAAILGDLVNVGALHEPQANVRMPETVCGATVAVAVEFQPFLCKDGIEQRMMGEGEQPVRWLGLVAFTKPDKGVDSASGTFAIAHTALSADLDFQNGFAGCVILYDGDIAIFKPRRFVGSKAGVSHEENVIVQLLGSPSPILLGRILCSSAGGFVKLTVFGRRKPCAMGNLAGCLVWRRKVGNERQPAVPMRRFQHLAKRDNFLVHRASTRHLSFLDGLRPEDPVLLHFPRSDFGQNHVSEVGKQVVVDSGELPFNMIGMALALG